MKIILSSGKVVTIQMGQDYHIEHWDEHLVVFDGEGDEQAVFNKKDIAMQSRPKEPARIHIEE